MIWSHCFLTRFLEILFVTDGKVTPIHWVEYTSDLPPSREDEFVHQRDLHVWAVPLEDVAFMPDFEIILV